MGHMNWAGHWGRPSLLGCTHSRTVNTVTAGLERIVCEGCGRVSIRYAGGGAFWPGAPGMKPGEPEPAMVVEKTPAGQPRCTACGAMAIFLTPFGIACNEHAWVAASKQEFLGPDFWIPRLIDGHGARRLMDDLASGEGTVVDLTWREPDERPER